MSKILGISLFVLALAIVLVPQFTHCREDSRRPVFADALSTIGQGGNSGRPAAGGGRPGSRIHSAKKGILALSTVAVVLGISAILVPTALTGTCPGGIMRCNTLMKPSLFVFGTLTVIGGITGIIISRAARS